MYFYAAIISIASATDEKEIFLSWSLDEAENVNLYVLGFKMLNVYVD